MIEPYQNHLGRKHQIVRMLWTLCWSIGARWLPRSIGSGWKRCLLRLFGAKIASTAVVYSSAKIYYPPNLIMDEYSCLASDVVCYNVALVHIGAYATVSQSAFLCTASHDITSSAHTLITAPIIIGSQAWIGVKAYIGMGVTVGDGAVVGATTSVYKSVEPWTIVGGNPAKALRKRVLTSINNRGG